MLSSLGTLLIAIAVLAVLVLLFREVSLWYWKINDILRLLQSIDNKLGATTSLSRAPVVATNDEEAEELFQRASKKEAKQHYDEAVAMYKGIIRDYPNSGSAQEAARAIESLKRQGYSEQ